MITDVDISVTQDVDFDYLKTFLKDISLLYPDFNHWLHDRFYLNLSSGERKIILAHHKNEILGLSLLKKNDNKQKICTLYVKEEYRNNKIGNLILDKSLEILDSKKSIITVSDERLNELNPLLSKKFYLVTSHKDLYKKGSSEHIFTLK